MPLIYCGIDEAGYGPLLGPLCVGAAVFRVQEWSEGDEAPDLWKLLKRAVCRKGTDKKHRIAIDDSKKLKLANNSVSTHPLHHLERGVLAFMHCCNGDCPERPPLPDTDHAFFQRTGVAPLSECWYGTDALPFPASHTHDQIAVTANTLRLALSATGVTVLGLRAQAVGETMFNQVLEASGTKAAVTESVLVQYLADVWECHAVLDQSTPGGVRVVCDRQGGRTQYAGLLQRAFPEAEVVITAETPSQSRYEVKSRPGTRPERRMAVAFKVEAESAHLPVALASMLAKLTREAMMARFNRYWCGRMPELKPTAGYSQDARRWLGDVQNAITNDERRALVRRA